MDANPSITLSYVGKNTLNYQGNMIFLIIVEVKIQAEYT